MELKFTKDNFDAEVIGSDIPVLVDFFATWCGPCQLIAPIIEEIAEEYAGKVKVGKINVDEEQALAIRYGIQSIPTLLIFKNGEVAEKIVGLRSKEAITKLFTV